MSKIPDEFTLLISRKFENADCWDLSQVLQAFKLEVVTQEKSLCNKSLKGEDSITTAALNTGESKKSKFFFLCALCR